MAEEGEIQGTTIVDGEQTPSTDTPDVAALQAEITELKATADKAANDKRAAEGRLRKTQDTDHQIADLRAERAEDQRITTATLKALAAGETEGLADQLSTIENESAQSRSQRKFAAGWNSIMDDMDGLVTDEDGEKLLDYNTVPELETWRATVRDHYNKGDLAGIASTLGELSRAAHKARGATVDARIAAARTEEQEAAKARMEKAGVHDLDAGRGAGGGGTGDSTPTLSRTDRMGNAIGKLKGSGKDFAITPTTKT